MLNAFSVDLETWFFSHHFADRMPFKIWGQQDFRLESVTQMLLDLLEAHNVRATFFVVGWLAERRPDLVHNIASAGHSIHSHSYAHRLVNSMTQSEFDEDLCRSIEALHQASGRTIRGFRAPAFSITARNAWALDVLQRRGITFDSSLHPPALLRQMSLRGTAFGIHRLDNGLVEIPPSCTKILGQTFACGGGGFFRRYPYPVFRGMLRACNRSGRPAIFYIHPWELDSELTEHVPREIRRHHAFVNIKQTYKRLERLLSDFRFGSIEQVLEQEGFAYATACQKS
jgi:polysaccharide deacetylase family protein (PEP-CTERM system associated)